MWRGLAVVFALVSLAACSFQISPPVSGDLQVGGYQIAQLPPAQEKGGELRPGVQVYRIALNATQAVRVSAVSADLQLRARMRLVLLDEQGVVQAVSVARNWFGAYPEVTPLALHPQIATDPGLRLNFRGQVGQVFYLRIENYALSADRVTLYADAFTPNPAGQGEAFTSGTRTGAIEFAREFDRYNVAGASGYLRFAYSGPLDLVALLYLSSGDPSPLTLDAVMNCVFVSPATLLVVRDRALARAGFNEAGSGQYTLTLSPNACP